MKINWTPCAVTYPINENCPRLVEWMTYFKAMHTPAQSELMEKMVLEKIASDPRVLVSLMEEGREVTEGSAYPIISRPILVGVGPVRAKKKAPRPVPSEALAIVRSTQNNAPRQKGEFPKNANGVQPLMGQGVRPIVFELLNEHPEWNTDRDKLYKMVNEQYHLKHGVNVSRKNFSGACAAWQRKNPTAPRPHNPFQWLFDQKDKDLKESKSSKNE